MAGTVRPESSICFVKKGLKACFLLASWAIWVPKAPSHTNPASRKLPTQKADEHNKWLLLVLLHFHSLGTKVVGRVLRKTFWVLPGCCTFPALC